MDSDEALVVRCFECGGTPAHFVSPDAGWLCEVCDPPDEDEHTEAR